MNNFLSKKLINIYQKKIRGEFMTLAQLWEKRGLEKGIEQVAERLLKEGFEVDLVSKVTELKPEQLQKLLKEQVY